MLKYLRPLVMIGIVLASCNDQPKRIDLARLNLNEKVATLINYKDDIVGGVNTVEVPTAAVIEISNTSLYSFNGIPLDTTEVIFQLSSVQVRRDKDLHNGGGHFNIIKVKSDKALKKVIDHFKADSVIYGYRVELKSKAEKARIFKELVKLYGTGTKNPKVENGVYWNIKDKNRLVLFTPEYDRLIVLNTTNLSKTCYWDNMNGGLDFGGCDMEKYVDDLFFRKK
jgi:hypothetical protein